MKTENNGVTREELIAQGCTEKVTTRYRTPYFEDANGDIVAKKCNKCAEIKVMEDFNRSKRVWGGRDTACRACRRSFREEHTVAVTTLINSWRASHPDKVAIMRQRRRAREASLPDTITDSQWANVVAYFGGGCALTSSNNFVMEHALPLDCGHGGTTLENMTPMRRDINASKNASHIFEWFNANRERFGLSQEKFDALIAYLAEVNGMTTKEYRMYVDWCFDNPRDIDDLEMEATG